MKSPRSVAYFYSGIQHQPFIMKGSKRHPVRSGLRWFKGSCLSARPRYRLLMSLKTPCAVGSPLRLSELSLGEASLSLGADEFALACFFLLSIQVWSLEQPEWHCKIDEGSAGLVASCWSPDGRHILNTTEFHVSVSPKTPYWPCDPVLCSRNSWGVREGVCLEYASLPLSSGDSF